ncbi:hypothetical protein P692DRAFT_20736111 [Suillus brevipes Sb2]|nr:hypothetical protein P692DRAFT_20736111 [Suillus brevipes Sb2]
MPLHTNSTAPRFGGDYTQLVNFLESVERLAQPLGLSDKEIIKYALKYTAPNERELFQYYEGNTYEDFANFALFMYPECGTKCCYMRPTRAQSAIPPLPLEAPPLRNEGVSTAPQQPECASEQPVAATMAPVHKTCETIPLPPTPVAPIIEIALTPAHIEAPIIGKPTEPQSDPEDQLVEVISPQLKPTAIANAPNVPLEEIASPIISNDLKHPSHFSVPIQEYFAVPQLPNVPYLDQNHVSGDTDVPPVHHIAPEVAHVTHFEALYIQPSHISPFSLVSRFELSRSFSSVATSAKVPKSGKVQQGPDILLRPHDAFRGLSVFVCHHARYMYLSRKALLDPFNLMAASRGISRLALSRTGLRGKPHL